jgi:hypothetical protein
MQGRQKQIIEAYQRVQDFLATYPAPAPASYAGPKQVLDDVVARLTSHSSAQVSGHQLSRSELKRQKALERNLRDRHMRPIVRIARMAIEPEPGIAEKLTMPPTSVGFLKLIAAAQAMRQAAAPYQATFVQNGLPENFLEQFAESETALSNAVVLRGRNIGTKAGAGAGLALQLSRGRKAVEALDSIVIIAFNADPVVLAAWRVAKRVKGLPGGGRTPTSEELATQPVVTPEAA